MGKVASVKSPQHPRARDLYDLEGPIHDTRNAAKIVDLILESLLQNEHPSTVAHQAGCRAFLWEKQEVEALLHAIYSLQDLSNRAVDAFNDAAHSSRVSRAESQLST